MNDTAFLARLNPALAQPFRQGFSSALDIAFLVSALVMGAALVLALLIGSAAAHDRRRHVGGAAEPVQAVKPRAPRSRAAAP